MGMGYIARLGVERVVKEFDKLGEALELVIVLKVEVKLE